MQVKQRIFNCTDMQIIHFMLDEILKMILHAFLSSVVAKLCDLKNSQVFLAHPVFNCFDRIPRCDRQTDIFLQHNSRYAYASRGKKSITLPLSNDNLIASMSLWKPETRYNPSESIPTITASRDYIRPPR